MADKPNETGTDEEVGKKTQKPPEKARAGAADTAKKPPRSKGRTKLPPKNKIDAGDKPVVPTPKPKAERDKGRDGKGDAPKKSPPKAKTDGGRVTPKGTRPAKTKVSSMGGPEASSRYTPPSLNYDDMPSPIWVPILMFTMFGLGMLVIFLNYVELLPGATSNWYLLVGLGLILAGIITATQYR